MHHPLRIFYAAGPGDVLGTYRHWKEGHDDPSQVAMTYSGQFYDVVRELDAEALVVGSSTIPGSLRDGRFRIEHRPAPFRNCGGFRYHLGQTLASLRLLWQAWRFKADVMVVCESGHWFPFRLSALVGIKIIPSLHSVIWARGQRPSLARRLVNALNRRFFLDNVLGIMTASRETGRQVDQLTRGRHQPIYEFLPTYRRQQFFGLPTPSPGDRPFRVFYAGRIERDKGVFDLLEIARRFDREGRTEIEFDLCGDGSALADLRAAVAEAGPAVAARFRCHGHCNRTTMRRMFAASHVVIVPTQGILIEGFNQVVVEGVLSGRPVITSKACPALEYVTAAAVEVGVDDVRGYGDAILHLCDDPVYYQVKRAACQAAQDQFYDEGRGWAMTLKRVLRAAGLIASPEPEATVKPCERKRLLFRNVHT
jgi:glycogen(starch) synthase